MMILPLHAKLDTEEEKGVKQLFRSRNTFLITPSACFEIIAGDPVEKKYRISIRKQGRTIKIFWCYAG